MPGLEISVETQAGARLGPGPLASASRWQQVRRLDRAGTIALTAPATDERTTLLGLRRYVRCRNQIVGLWSDVGTGIIDALTTNTDARSLSATGSDLLRELALRSVSFTALADTDGGGNPIPVSLTDALGIVLTACNTQADPDWTLDATTYASVGDTTNASGDITNVTNIENWEGREGCPIFGAGIPDGAVVLAVDTAAAELSIAPFATATASGVALSRSQVYYTYAGESILQAFIKLAELTGTHFRLGGGREIVWLYNIKKSSGVRAVIGVDPDKAESNQDICLITSLEVVEDSSDLISHVHVWGSGSGSSRMSMAGTSRLAPDGYTLDTVNNVIRRDAAETDYGYSIRHQTFSDIGPVLSPDDADYATALFQAQNTLFDAGLEYLRQHSYPMESYRLGLAKLDRQVLPGQTIRVIYRGFVDILDEQTGEVRAYRWIDLNRDVLVLEAVTEIDASGVRTSGVTVATLDRWPQTDRDRIVTMKQQIQQGIQHDQSSSHALTTEGVDVVSGKTLAVSNSLTLAGTDGEALTLSGSLDVGADTTISGGGTLALGGFTLTAPATGTAALLGVNNIFTIGQIIVVTDAGTNNTATPHSLRHNTSGTPTTNFGVAQAYTLQTSGVGGAPDMSAARTRVVWTVSNHATRTSAFAIDTVQSAGSFVQRVLIDHNGLTIPDGENIIVGTSTGLMLGTSTSQKWAAHGATPVIQRPGAAQAAVATTAATQTTPWGFSTQAQADAIITLLNEIRAALVEKGIIKGSA